MPLVLQSSLKSTNINVEYNDGWAKSKDTLSSSGVDSGGPSS
jgi:hypothetical protein